MLLTKEVEVAIVHRNKKYYKEKGYADSIPGNTIKVKIEDLPSSSSKKLEVKCDYCDDDYEIRYCDYIRTKHEFLNNDACKKCWHKKRMDITNYKAKNKLINNPNEKGYWKVKENIKKELHNFILDNDYIGRDGSDDVESNRWRAISRALKLNNINLNEVVSELGYDIKDLQKRNPNGYVIPFEELKSKIDNFVKEFGFFPDQIHLANDLNIHSSSYLKHGTIPELREKLGYNDKKYLVDNRGFINKSNFELITANYLIAQNISYKREQYPFKKFDENLNYRSDFTLYLLNREIHVEVWGGMKTFNGQKPLYDYDSVMNKKLELYNKYNVELISVTPDIFYNSMSTIKKKLYKVFSNYIDLPFITVEDRLVSTYTLHEMSDDELFKNIMDISKKYMVLPSYEVMRETKNEYLFKEVLKRYDSLQDFADKFNVITAYEARKKKYKDIPILTPTS